MLEHRIGDITVYSFERFDGYRRVTNVVTSRCGGRSAAPYDGLNLGFRAGDDEGAVLANRALLSRALGFDRRKIVTGQQVHKTSVRRVTAEEAGKGALRWQGGFAETDALVTDVPDLPLMVLVADCTPLSFYDPENRIAGVAHAGWRGTLARIAERVVRFMEADFGSRPSEIIAGVGPAIGRCHYEVGPEVYDAFKSEFGEEADGYFTDDEQGKRSLDLWGANKAGLLTAGLTEDNIAVSTMCTACNPTLFYSHRHGGGRTGRFANLIMLHGEVRRTY